jgi:hypothetical protein
MTLTANALMQDFVLSVALTPHGDWVLSGSKDRGVQFWDPHTGVAQLMLQGHKNSGMLDASLFASDSVNHPQSSLLRQVQLEEYSRRVAVTCALVSGGKRFQHPFRPVHTYSHWDCGCDTCCTWFQALLHRKRQLCRWRAASSQRAYVCCRVLGTIGAADPPPHSHPTRSLLGATAIMLATAFRGIHFRILATRSNMIYHLPHRITKLTLSQI